MPIGKAPTVEKATAIIKAYRKNNYNAKKALLEVGYSSTTAQKKSGEVIEMARRILARDELELAAQQNRPPSTARAFVKMSDNEIGLEYLKIILQDKDLAIKLKALMPLLKEKGVVFDNEQVSIKPTVNLTMVKKEAINKEMGGGTDGDVDGGSRVLPPPNNVQNHSFPEEIQDNVSTIDDSYIGGSSSLGPNVSSSEVDVTNNSESELSQGNL